MITIKEVNEHAEIIRNSVFHSYPYNRMGFKPDAPHAEDCEGCLINAEVYKLVTKLNALSNVEKIIDELENERKERQALTTDRNLAFEIAGLNAEGEGSISDLVIMLIDERDRLIQLLATIRTDIIKINNKMIE